MKKHEYIPFSVFEKKWERDPEIQRLYEELGPEFKAIEKRLDQKIIKQQRQLRLVRDKKMVSDALLRGEYKTTNLTH